MESLQQKEPTALWRHYWRHAVLLALRQEGLLTGEEFRRAMEKWDKEAREWQKEQ